MGEKKTSSPSFTMFAEVCWDCSNFGKSERFNREEAVVPAHRGDAYLNRAISVLIHIMFPSVKKNSSFHLRNSEGKD